MTIEKISKAARARGMAFTGERYGAGYYSILTPNGYYHSTKLRDIYRVVKLYDKIDYRVSFRGSGGRIKKYSIAWN